MEKMEAKLEKVTSIKESLLDIVKMTICGDLSAVDTHELGEIVDMINDLAETEKNCWEAMQAKCIVKAMKETEDNPILGREMAMKKLMSNMEDMMGYNSNRYASGRYAPRGHGNSTMGYSEYPRMEEDPWRGQNNMMGYSGSSGSGGSSGGRGGSSGGGRGGSSGGRSSGGGYGYHEIYGGTMMDDYDPRYGESYNRYKNAKRHYSESKSSSDKEQMNEHAKKHMEEAMASMKEIYSSSQEPELKKKFKEDMLKLINDLPNM